MVREMKHTEIGDIPVDWKVQTFEETFRVLSNNTLSRAELNDRRGSVRNIHYGDILTKFSEVLDCGDEDIPFLNDTSMLTASAMPLQDGDVIIADTAEDDTVGKATEIVGLGDKKMVSGLHTIPCRVKKGDFASEWLGYYMNSHVYHDQVLPYVTGIKVSSIAKSAIAETLVLIPPKKEQEAIVDVISQVDNLVISLQKLVAKRKAIKQGTMQILLEAKVRLNGYNVPWNSTPLGELREITSTIRVHENDWTKNGIPFYRAREIVALHNNQEITPLHISEELYRQNTSRCGEIANGDVLITGVGTIGIPYLVKNDEKFYFKDGNIIWVKNSKPLDGEYLFYQYDGVNIRKQIDDMAGVGTVGTYTIDGAKKTIIPLPSIEEQREIACVLRETSQDIVILEKKLQKYMRIKQGMMSELLTGKIRLV